MRQNSPDCSFCGRTNIEPGKFVLGPERCICHKCIEECSLALLDFSEGENRIFQTRVLNSERCEFCGKKSKEVWRLLTGYGKHICSECIELANDILGDMDASNEINILRAAKLSKLNKAPLPAVISRGGWVIGTRNRFLRKVFERIF